MGIQAGNGQVGFPVSACLQRLIERPPGQQVGSQVPCDASLGLANGTMCNAIDAPGVDPVTKRPRAIETSLVPTTEAAARGEKMIADAESAVYTMVYLSIGMNSVFFLLNLGSGLFNLRKHLRAKAQANAASQGAPPTLATNDFAAKGGVVDA